MKEKPALQRAGFLFRLIKVILQPTGLRTMKPITVRTEVNVRFNEADPLGIVWHGHYIRYFEDGREAFGRKYGCSYLDFYKNGLVVPIVHVECDYKKSLKYGDTVIVESTYIPTVAAKIKFQFNLYNAATGDLVAKGSTTQVFLEKESNSLLLITPKFFAEWQEKVFSGAECKNGVNGQ